MDCYLAAWFSILTRFGEWRHNDVAEFANDDHPYFKSAFLGHDVPLEEVLFRLIPDSIPTAQHESVAIQIRDAINCGYSPCCKDHFSPHLDEFYDWNETRRRIDLVLSEYRQP